MVDLSYKLQIISNPVSSKGTVLPGRVGLSRGGQVIAVRDYLNANDLNASDYLNDWINEEVSAEELQASESLQSDTANKIEKFKSFDYAKSGK